MDKQERRETRDAARAVAAWMDQARRAQDVAGRHPRGGTAPARRPCRSRGAGRSRGRGGVAGGAAVAGRRRVAAPRPGRPREPPAAGRHRRRPGSRQLTDRAPAAVDAARVLSPVRWVFASRKRREQLGPHATYLRELFAWGLQAGLTRGARPAGDSRPGRSTPPSCRSTTSSTRGSGSPRRPGPRRSPALLDGTRFGELPRAMADLRAATGAEAAARDAVVAAVAAIPGAGGRDPRWRRCRSRR